MTKLPVVINQIREVEFGLLSADDIKRLSVCEITNAKLFGDTGSVYDPRLGPMENNQKCVTCGCNNKDCPGHFSYIELGMKMINPLQNNIALQFLKCFCFQCSSMLQTKEHLYLNGIVKIRPEVRFKKASEILQKITVCPNCGVEQPLFFENKSDKTIFMCPKKSKRKNDQTSIKVSIEDICRVFDNISSDDIELIGINPKLSHPKNLIMSRLFVLPPRSRPYVVTDGQTCDDDLTTKYTEIIKYVNKLKDLKSGKVAQKKGSSSIISDEEKQKLEEKYEQSIKFHIATLFDNSQQKARVTGDRAIKGIKQRLSGKEGLMRMNILGKRVNNSGRTVIGPNPTLDINEIQLPRVMAETLFRPVLVNKYNINALQKLIENDGANCVVKSNGVRINLKYATIDRGTQLMYNDIVLRNGEEIYPDSILTFKLKGGDKIKRLCDGGRYEIIDVELSKHKPFILECGDVVQRKLIDGDYVLINRQPTLHKGSMMASKIKVYDGLTIQLPLSVTGSYNADFDGDEMNVHNPQSLPAVAELEHISEVTENIMNVQNAQPNIKIVQDHMLMCYLMTYRWTQIPKEDFMQLCCGLKYSLDQIINKIKHIKRMYKLLNIPHNVYNSKALFSMVFPDTLFYEGDSSGCMDENEKKIIIKHGVIVSGCLTKPIVNSGSGLIAQIHKDYGKFICRDFIDNVCKITYQWIFYRGFSIGYEDCLVKEDNNIDMVLNKCYMKAAVAEGEPNPKIRELKITAALNEARDVGNNLAQKGLDIENNIKLMVVSGAKGDKNNLAQIVGIVGQQNSDAGRLPLSLAHNTKAMYCYPEDQDMDANMSEIKYESRGFNRSSYMDGLNPREFWSHAVTGRIGLFSTALLTADTGYLQRRMCKVFENIKIHADGTVRGSNNHILAFAYGGDGMKEDQITKTKKGPRVCDVNRIINKLNGQVEQLIHITSNNKIDLVIE